VSVIPDGDLIMSRVVYAGSFDPPTLGHLWMIEEGARLFESLTVAVGTNPDKTDAFTVEERISMLTSITNGIDANNVDVAVFDNRYLVHYARSVGAHYILRGIRSPADFEYERVMRHINSDICPDITTVFLMPPRQIAEVSSSLVKGMVGPKGWEETVQTFVPEVVFDMLCKRFG
jgi:pantetheine-phosphate adenylyltransferase